MTLPAFWLIFLLLENKRTANDKLGFVERSVDMENIKLSHTLKSYSMVFLVGIFIGCICRLLDYCSLDSLWGFSSIQTLLGFWIITNTIIVLLSTSNKCAGISSFLYMFGMTLSFYGLQAILEMFIPLFSGGFRFSLFVLLPVLNFPDLIYYNYLVVNMLFV